MGAEAVSPGVGRRPLAHEMDLGNLGSSSMSQLLCSQMIHTVRRSRGIVTWENGVINESGSRKSHAIASFIQSI